MKYSFLIFFLVSCGMNVDYSLFEEYKPDSRIQQVIFTLNGLENVDVEFYHGNHNAMVQACGDDSGYEIGCNFYQYNQIFIDTKFKDSCYALAHELTHQALYLATGDSFGNHKHKQFENLWNVCLTIENGTTKQENTTARCKNT